MFKGLAALISSGVLFTPMILLGVVTGFFLTFTMFLKDIYALFGDIRFYLLALVIALIYEIGLRLTIKKSQGFKFPDLALSILGSAAKLAVAVIFSVFFVMLIGGGSFGEENSFDADF